MQKAEKEKNTSLFFGFYSNYLHITYTPHLVYKSFKTPIQMTMQSWG